jgi:soluble lytic murein transglycosylase-like protein
VWFILGIALIIAAGIVPIFMPKALANTVAAWNELALRWAKKRDLPVSLVLAVIHQESRGNAKAKGPTADYGLMQITQPALTDFNKANSKSYTLQPDMFDPEKNVEVGSWYLFWLKGYLKTTDWSYILRAYNAGPGRAKKEKAASQGYASSVLAFQDRIKTMGV